MNEKLVLDIIGQIEGRLIWLLLKLMLAGIAVMILKNFLQRIAAYIQFSTNKQLSIGRHVKVRGVSGVIRWYNTWNKTIRYSKEKHGVDIDYPIKN